MKTFLCLLLGALILVLNITMSSCQRFPLSETNVDMKFDSLVNELAPPPGFWHRLRQTSQAQQVLERVRVINNLNEITRGGSTSTDLDQILQSLSLWLAGIVAWQSLTTLFCHNDNLFHEIADRFLSPESAKAVKTIRQILQQFPKLGVVDVFAEYPTRDVILSILALGKLQTAAALHAASLQQETRCVQDADLLRKLAHYAVYASAAYGWTLEAALRRKLHWRGNLQALLKKTGIEPDDVLVAAWESKTHRPAYFVVRDVRNKAIVLCIRGTLSARDMLTNLCATATTYSGGCAHHGMVEAAKSIADETLPLIQQELQTHPNYNLVLVGHSLGGGVAAVLGTLWQKACPKLHVYNYGAPCVGPMHCRPTTCNNIFSIIAEGDPFCCLSLGHLVDVSNALAKLCRDEELRSMILMRTDGNTVNESDLEWCADTLLKLRSSTNEEKLYPPGRVLYLQPANSHVQLREIPQSRFADLRLHPRMLDVTRHVPSLYESLLEQIYLQTKIS